MWSSRCQSMFSVHSGRSRDGKCGRKAARAMMHEVHQLASAFHYICARTQEDRDVFWWLSVRTCGTLRGAAVLIAAHVPQVVAAGRAGRHHAAHGLRRGQLPARGRPLRHAACGKHTSNLLGNPLCRMDCADDAP